MPLAQWKVQGETLSWSPTVEVKKVNGKFLVAAELPGLKKGDIKVQVTEDALILEGERNQEKEEKGRAITIPNAATGTSIARFRCRMAPLSIRP